MKIVDARWTLTEVRDRDYQWLKFWGLSTIKEAIRTIRDRKSATTQDLQRAEQISTIILLKQ